MSIVIYMLALRKVGKLVRKHLKDQGIAGKALVRKGRDGWTLRGDINGVQFKLGRNVIWPHKTRDGWLDLILLTTTQPLPAGVVTKMHTTVSVGTTKSGLTAKVRRRINRYMATLKPLASFDLADPKSMEKAAAKILELVGAA